MKEETIGLNMKFKDAKNKLIFSYQDVVVILEKLLKEQLKEDLERIEKEVKEVAKIFHRF